MRRSENVQSISASSKNLWGSCSPKNTMFGLTQPPQWGHTGSSSIMILFLSFSMSKGALQLEQAAAENVP